MAARLSDWRAALALAWIGTCTSAPAADQDVIVIGSKNFSESYLLAEIAALWLETGGFEVRRQLGFGGTKVTYEALRSGEIDLYPEYTGTVSEVILNAPAVRTIDEINGALSSRALRLVGSPGFNNTYALAMRGDAAATLGIESISDLRSHPELRLALSHELLERNDGWRGLKNRYALPHSPSSIAHGLAYQALIEDKIDLTDAYSTDGDIPRYGLRLLHDDLGYFPDYRAAWFIRDDLPDAVVQRLTLLAGTIDDSRMRELNRRVVVDKISFAELAREFIATLDQDVAQFRAPSDNTRLWRNVWRHLQLTVCALLAATIAGSGLALLTYRRATASRAVLYVAGLFQTVPSIALLALMLPLFGVGFLPAVTALFLYSLLPILRSTLTALNAIDPVYRRVAAAIGMNPREEFRHVLLPLALPHVIAGIRTASVISIGTATLAAFIGAGGLGQPIVTGLALNDTGLILRGAVPAAILAILTDLGFDLLERRLVPAHMRASHLAT